MNGDTPDSASTEEIKKQVIQKAYKEEDIFKIHNQEEKTIVSPSTNYKTGGNKNNIEDTEEFIEENLCLADMEKALIIKALDKFRGKRKNAADELGISERTLYRKIKDYNINA
jgi:DNA-binding NtrC family response regulator